MPGTIKTKAPAKLTTLSAVVTRADGTVEDLGVIAYQHKNPLLTLWWRFKQLFKRRRK